MMRPKRSDKWNNLPWKSVDLSSTDLGNYDDAIFFGLEEIDGAEYEQYLEKKGHQQEDHPVKNPKPIKQKKEAIRREQILNESNSVDNSSEEWSHPISLHNQLVASLRSLSFHHPTPIQSISIPIILSGKCDVVGSAETGSGKTLAFGLPILHSLLNDWDSIENRQRHSPYALILAPTRELAVQISTVMNDVCKSITVRKVQIVNIIGGMSEQKQRRLLSNVYRPVHILVSTPGRLCDLISDSDLLVLQDLSRLRYLVVDEADRMVEDGHFPELFKVFNLIRRHEKISSLGKDPIDESHVSQGFSQDDTDRETPNIFSVDDIDNIGIEENVDFQFDEMPSDEAILAAQNDSSQGLEHQEESTTLDLIQPYIPNLRQTLLFSATAMTISKEEGDSKRRRKQLKKEQALAGPRRVAYLQSLGIPEHLRQLLETVGIQERTEVAIASPLKLNEEGGIDQEKNGKKRKVEGEEVSSQASLPPGLKQLEIRVPVEEKDLIAYFFLLKVFSHLFPLVHFE